MSENEIKNENVTTTTTKSQTWLNRIYSALVGAALAICTTLGITSEKINDEKAKVKTIQTQAKEALEAIKSGDIKTAQTKLTEATQTTKEVIAKAKEVIEKAKETDKTELVKAAVSGAKEAITKDNMKKAEASSKMYTEK